MTGTEATAIGQALAQAHDKNRGCKLTDNEPNRSCCAMGGDPSHAVWDALEAITEALETLGRPQVAERIRVAFEANERS